MAVVLTSNLFSQSKASVIFSQTFDLKVASDQFSVDALPVRTWRAVICSAASSELSMKNMNATSRMAKISVKNGMASSPNSTAAAPSLSRIRRPVNCMAFSSIRQPHLGDILLEQAGQAGLDLGGGIGLEVEALA